MIYTIHRMMQAVLRGLKARRSKKGQLCADDILPAFVLVVTRASVSQLNQHVFYMDQFTGNS